MDSSGVAEVKLLRIVRSRNKLRFQVLERDSYGSGIGRRTKIAKP